ncbi:MAG: methylated-DNA--[protein]-cysteine S-methyltransferase [Gammaproteobacteria bacterium]|nr:methylated-DNA--[protein]-cysteine S-methyltransferase [Gammaproteobacteria bacterium]
MHRPPLEKKMTMLSEQEMRALNRLVEVARYIESHADERLPLARIADQAGLSASRLQRIFKQAFGLSPKAFQDAVRMKRFKSSLKKGGSVTDAIFSSGFGSTSRVYGEATRNIGMAPKAYRAGGAGEVISYACRDTALGSMTMAATKKGVCFVQFGEDGEDLLAQLKVEFPKAQLTESSAQNTVELDAWIDALDKHISTAAPRPDLPIDLRGTAFQMQVWQFLTSIHEGDVLTYSELAAQINKPKAVRAVASACAANRIGVLIPCHRVLRSDGGLGGYRWGLERKRALLDAERARCTGS